MSGSLESRTRLSSAAWFRAWEKCAEGPRDHALWRLHPERWLESLVVREETDVDERLDASSLFSRVPAFSALDRAMIDGLTVTRAGRLAVVELKADQDIHLPLQGLDYSSRVAWHHARAEFQRFGYFPGHELSPQRPLLFLLAAALHVHPATDTLLHSISPEIEWVVVGIDGPQISRLRLIYFSGQAPSKRRTSTSWAR